MSTRRSPAQSCTVGVVRTDGGYLCFKNRDLAHRHAPAGPLPFERTPDLYALLGVDLHRGTGAGVSIGVNAHSVSVANTHVVSAPDIAYDVLCRELLEKVRRHADVATTVERFCAAQPVQGGRILVCAPGWTQLVEVYRQHHSIVDVAGNLAITNGFSLLPNEELGVKPHGESSRTRLETANRALATIGSPAGLKEMLRSHTPQKGDLCICRHAESSGTESSHIICVENGAIRWEFVHGNPCEHEYQAVEGLFA